MLRSSNILKINSINNFEQLFIFLVYQFFFTFNYEINFLITINFHKNSINNKKYLIKQESLFFNLVYDF